jgi:hypothetical protein
MSSPTNAERAKRAAKALVMCQHDIEALIDATPLDDRFTLELLGPVLADLKTAQAAISRLADKRTNTL